MKILLVEDELKVVTVLKKGFEEEEYAVDVAFDGKTGHLMSLSNQYDIIVLDISLPIFNGYELCELIRRRNVHVPILMLTALGTTDNKVEALNLGADDYVVKPFEFKELLARVRALTRRANPDYGPTLLQADNLELNTLTKVVRSGDTQISLTAREFSLLELLLQHKNEVLSRTYIAEQVWALNFDTGTNVVDVYINYLRNKIDKPFKRRLIQTVVGMGYSLRDSE
ncbi:response regulator transcription factor [Hymenobacter sp. NBH84]|uniref:Response regulator transcription factor n=1 Tax=Hymenobacter defluvii TaxID=2054411 RepID=A0ABS3T750_9BACT|nr:MULTISPECIES: response regulator transcription factor [Hymenobacter]MBO3269038.1 response regulator transcription factor [Hymenobacter defluvii]QNE38710.1 response regulator transcription factor [Hymenobacter sp. NBH84]